MKFPKFSQLTALCLSAAFVANSPAADLPDQWLKDFDAAKTQAAEEEKPILAVFSTTWCAPCQQMVKEIYPKPEMIKYLNDWVPVYIDGDKFGELGEQLGVEAFPTYILFDAAGEESGRFVGGAASVEEFIQRIENAGKLKERIADLEKKIAAAPKDASLLRELGALAFENDLMEKGLDAYKKALTLAPEQIEGMDPQLVEYLKDLMKFDKEIAAMDAQVKADAENPDLLKARGDLYLGDIFSVGPERMEKALADYEAARELDPENDTGVAEEIGFLKIMQKGEQDPASVKVELDAYVARYTESRHLPTATFLQGMILLQTDKIEAGRDKIKTFVDTYPEHPMAEQAQFMLPMIEQMLQQGVPVAPGEEGEEAVPGDATLDTGTES